MNDSEGLINIPIEQPWHHKLYWQFWQCLPCRETCYFMLIVPIMGIILQLYFRGQFNIFGYLAAAVILRQPFKWILDLALFASLGTSIYVQTIESVLVGLSISSSVPIYHCPLSPVWIAFEFADRFFGRKWPLIKLFLAQNFVLVASIHWKNQAKRRDPTILELREDLRCLAEVLKRANETKYGFCQLFYMIQAEILNRQALELLRHLILSGQAGNAFNEYFKEIFKAVQEFQPAGFMSLPVVQSLVQGARARQLALFRRGADRAQQNPVQNVVADPIQNQPLGAPLLNAGADGSSVQENFQGLGSEKQQENIGNELVLPDRKSQQQSQLSTFQTFFLTKILTPSKQACLRVYSQTNPPFFLAYVQSDGNWAQNLFNSMSFNYNELLKTKTDQVVGKLNWNGIDFSAPILDHVPENSYVIDSNPQIVEINPESEKQAVDDSSRSTFEVLPQKQD